MIYQLQGQGVYPKIKLKVFSENWSDADQRAAYLQKGKIMSVDVKKLNSKIEEFIHTVEKIET